MPQLALAEPRRILNISFLRKSSSVPAGVSRSFGAMNSASSSREISAVKRDRLIPAGTETTVQLRRSAPDTGRMQLADTTVKPLSSSTLAAARSFPYSSIAPSSNSCAISPSSSDIRSNCPQASSRLRAESA